MFKAKLLAGGVLAVLLGAGLTKVTFSMIQGAPVNVFDKGAKGDWNGTTGTDDTAAIQAAINASSGKVLEFPRANYKITSTLNINTTSGLIIKGNGATLSGIALEKIIEFTGNSTDITISGLKFTTTLNSAVGVFGLITGLNHNFTNIKIHDCDFTSPTGATNGIKFDNTTVGTALLGLEVSGNRFVSVGQMGVEVINHTFDDISRYEQVRIVNNRFDGLGLSSTYGMAVSLSGMGKNNVISGNNITQAKDIGLELVGPWHTVVSGNILRNLQANVTAISVGKPASAAVKPQGITIANNIVDGNGGISFQPTGIAYGSITGNVVTGTGKVSIEASDFMSITGNSMEVTNGIVLLTLTNSTVTGNRFSCLTNTAGYNVTITTASLVNFSGNTFQSERSTGLLVNGTSVNNTFVGGIFSNENSVAAGPALQFDGAAVTGNISTGAVFRRTAAGGTTWSQSTGATGNFIVAGLPNTVNPDSVSAPAPLSFTTGSNSWVTPLKVNGTFLYVDSANTLRLKTTAPTVDKDGTPTSQPPLSLFANLGTPANGTFFYCSDCTIANPCAGVGTGALAKRLNGVWVCN